MASAAGGRRTAGTAAQRVLPLSAALLLLSGVLLLLLDGPGLPWPWRVLLVAAVVLTELRPVHVARATERRSFTVTEGPLAAALALTASADVVVALMTGVLVAQLLRRRPRLRVVGDVARTGAAGALAAVTVQHVGGLAGTVLAVLLFTLVSDQLGRLVSVPPKRRLPPRRPLQEAGLGWLLYVLTVASIGYLSAQVFMMRPSMLPAFVAPALLAVWLQDQSNQRRVRSSVTRALAAQATSFYGRSSEETALLVIRTAREVLGASRAELVLLGEHSVVAFTEDEDGVRRERLPHADLVTGWRGRVFETTRAQAHGAWAGAVVGRGVPRALIGIWREEEQERFRSADAALLQTMADSVGEWLSPEDDGSAPLHALRRRLLDLGGEVKDVSEALGTLALVREELSGSAVSPAQRAALAEDLREVEQRVVDFLSALVVEQRAPSGQLVETGRWRKR